MFCAACTYYIINTFNKKKNVGWEVATFIKLMKLFPAKWNRLSMIQPGRENRRDKCYKIWGNHIIRIKNSMSKKRKSQLFILEAVSSNHFEVLTSVLIWYKQLINCSRPQHSVMIKVPPKKLLTYIMLTS